jgi:hypothetical protein
MPNISDIRRLSVFLDSRFRGPVGFRFGWDAIIGLFPVLGNTVTSAMSLYIIVRAADAGAPPSILLRMGLNVLIDNLFDIIPVFGTIFDVFWKSNLMNIALLDRYLNSPDKTRRSSKWVLALTILLVLILTVSLAWISFLALRWAFEYLLPGSSQSWVILDGHI